MKTIKNNAGFTLVELLAVIVVLAIIMIVAIPQVMDSMETAKINSFRVEARKLVSAAQAKMATDELSNTAYKTKAFNGNTFRCYLAKDIADTGNKYHGVLFYGPVGSVSAKWYVRLSDGEYTTYKGDTALTSSTNTTAKNITGYAIAAENIDKKTAVSGTTTTFYINKKSLNTSALTALDTIPCT